MSKDNSLPRVLTVNIAIHTVARMKPLDDRNSSIQGRSREFLTFLVWLTIFLEHERCLKNDAESGSDVLDHSFFLLQNEHVRKNLVR